MKKKVIKRLTESNSLIENSMELELTKEQSLLFESKTGKKIDKMLLEGFEGGGGSSGGGGASGTWRA